MKHPFKIASNSSCYTYKSVLCHNVCLRLEYYISQESLGVCLSGTLRPLTLIFCENVYVWEAGVRHGGQKLIRGYSALDRLAGSGAPRPCNSRKTLSTELCQETG